MSLKASFDLDDTIFEWSRYYVSIFGPPKTDAEITRNVRRVLTKDKDFWLSQPLMDAPDFIPHCYCTARIVSKSVIKYQLQINKLPNAPIYQVHGYGLSKYAQLKRSGADVHIDDSVSNFIDLNLKGIPCLLIDREHNRDWGPIGRIFSLKQDHIIETYHLFMKTMFPHFKDLVNAA